MHAARSILTALLAAATLLVVLTSPATAAETRIEQRERWQEEFDEVRRLCSESDWAPAFEEASALIAEMIPHLDAGPQDSKALASILTYRSFAEIGLGREEDAGWSWLIAQNLDPRLRDLPADTVEQMGEVFSANKLRQKGEAPPEIARVTAASDPSVSGPLAVRTLPPELPTSEEFTDAMQQAELSVELVIDPTGRVRAPVVVEKAYRTPPGLVVLALEALRGWRFRPATLAGEPVAVTMEVDPVAPRFDLAMRMAADPAVQPIHELALAADWAEVARRVEAARAVAVAEAFGNPNRSERLGLLSLLRAVVASVAGSGEEALLDRGAALDLVPGLRLEGLAAYGEPGRELSEPVSACEQGDWKRCPATPLYGPVAGTTPPRQIAGEPLRPVAAFAPERPRNPWVATDRAVVRTVIGADGRPRHIRLVKSRFPITGLLAMEAVADRRFEPAQRDGAPIPVAVELTVAFAADRSDEQIADWHRRLDRADQQLRQGEPGAAGALAASLVEEISAATGSSDLLARALLVRALAEAASGREADAVWSWYIAQNLAGQLAWSDLSPYGEAGALLAGHPLRRPGQLADGTAAPSQQAFVKLALTRTAGDDPELVEPFAGSRPEVEVAIRSGRPESPLVLSSVPAPVIVTALQALRGWWFTEAQPDAGKLYRVPVPWEADVQLPGLAAEASRFADAAFAALAEGELAKAECYWEHAPAIERRDRQRSFNEQRERLLARGGLVRESPIPVGGDVEPPSKVSVPAPQYTPLARRLRLQGVIIVQTVIDRQGDVRRVQLLKGLPHGLNQQAVEAICAWEFEPAMRDGEPVAVYYNLTVNFQLQATSLPRLRPPGG